MILLPRFKGLRLAWFAMMAVWWGAVPVIAAPVVSAPQGAVRGAFDGDSEVFRAIPYAVPPVGELRWRPPVPAPRWRGVRQAIERAPDCPQHYAIGQESYRGPSRQSEDCLYLNVWRPRHTRRDAKLPVMVWLHGGSFVAGSGSWSVYDGKALNQHGAIVVTLNYRLGVLGRFAHPTLIAEQPDGPWANYALMDQIRALEWVRDNITAFGGDPANVTLFGYSAGGVSVNYLMAAPSARGLFHRAISQSGGVQIEGSRHLFQEGVERLVEPLIPEGERMAAAFGVASIAELREVPVERLLEWQRRNLFGSLNPVVDGKLIERSIGEAFYLGEIAPVDYLAGSNSWEASLIAGSPMPPQAVLGGVSDLAEVKDHYGEMDDSGLAQSWFADNVFVGPAQWLADRVADRRGSSWTYHYAFVPKAVAGAMPGAAHGDEVPMVFGTLPGKIRGLNADAVSDEDLALSRLIQGYWANFARTGDPNGGDAPVWRANDGLSHSTMLFSEKSQSESAFRASLHEFLDRRYRRWMPSPAD